MSPLLHRNQALGALLIEATPSACGPIDVNGTAYRSGSRVTIPLNSSVPISAPGCEYEQWRGWTNSTMIEMASLSDEATTLVATGNGTLTGDWTYDGPSENVTIDVEPAGTGAVGLAGGTWTNLSTVSLDPGSYTVTADPYEWGVFLHWATAGQVTVSSGRVLVQGPGTIVAVFERQPVINFEVAPASCELSFGGTEYANGTSLGTAGGGESYDLVAVACSGVRFADWGSSQDFTVLDGLAPSTSGALWGNATVWLNDSAGPYDALTIDVIPANVAQLFVDGFGPLTSGQSVSVVDGVYPVSYELNLSPGNSAQLLRYDTSGNVTYQQGEVNVAGNGTLTAVFFPQAFVNLTIFPNTCLGVLVNHTLLINGNSGYYPISPVGIAVSALPCPGLIFRNWSTRGGLTVADRFSANAEMIIGGPGNLNATYANIPEATVVFHLSPFWVGTLDLNGTTVRNGSVRQLSAGYYPIRANLAAPQSAAFEGWAGSGAVDAPSGGVQGVLEVVGNGTVWANFTPYATVSIAVSPTECGGVSLNGTTYPNGTRAYLGPGTYPVTFPVCDWSGASIPAVQGDLTLLANDTLLKVWGNGTISIVSRTLALTVQGPTEVQVGADSVFNFTLEGGWPPYRWTVSWGDGSPNATGMAPNAGVVSVEHQWSSSNRYDMEADVQDTRGDNATTELLVDVTGTSNQTWVAPVAEVGATVTGVVAVLVVLGRRRRSSPQRPEGSSQRSSGGPSAEAPSTRPSPQPVSGKGTDDH